ncbi:MAG TPA: AEC family transporter [bacterium]|nr:AEC family transporter [bacterium]
MTGLLPVLTGVIGPVLLVAAVGYGVGRTRVVDVPPLTSLSVAVLVPALTFYALATSAVAHVTLLRITAYLMLQFALLGAATLAAARVAGWDRTRTVGVSLATMFSNAGNAGLPLALFAWGRAGLDAAVGFFAVQAVASSVLAAFLAAYAGADARRALRALLRLPVTYAAVAGLGVNLLGAAPPVPILKAAQLLADAAIAVMLLLVGVQLSATRLDSEWRGVAFATVTRLAVAPALAWATAPLMGLDGLVRQTSILQASLPTAITAAIWASEFGVVPGLVSSIVVVTTLVSPLTVTVLLALLR